MKELKQIVLCSHNEGYSFIRNIRVTSECALVTRIERLPFRYHEFLLKRRSRKDRQATFNVPFRGTTPHQCAYCSNTSCFNCKTCGYISCKSKAAPDHFCPGCLKTYPTEPARSISASNSGFVGINLFQGSVYWDRAQDALLELIDYRNRRSR